MSRLRISRVLRVVRETLGLSQLAAAEAALEQGYLKRLDSDAWSKLEREVREPTFEDAVIILRSLGVQLRFETLDGVDLNEVLEGIDE